MSKLVKVVYVSSSRSHKNEEETIYTFRTYLDLRENDLVVVESSNGFGLCIVKEVLDEVQAQGRTASYWIVAKVDVSEFYTRRANAIRRKNLENTIRVRAEEAIRAASLKALVQNDPELQRMYEELEAIETSFVDKELAE